MFLAKTNIFSLDEYYPIVWQTGINDLVYKQKQLLTRQLYQFYI